MEQFLKEQCKCSDATAEELEMITKSKPTIELTNSIPSGGLPNRLNIQKSDLTQYNEATIKRVADFKPQQFDNIKDVYFYFEYPLETEATIKVTFPEPRSINSLDLLSVCSLAYQWVYEEEEREVGNPGHIPGLMNRNVSHGRYGIWGHDLSDLIYNGFSQIKVYDSFIHCVFEVDS
eukprot:gene4313-5398_t